MQETIVTVNEQQLENALITAPVQAQERMEILDIIRGVALLGILLVHMPVMFGTPFIYSTVLGINMWTNAWDTIATGFVGIFVQGKFYTMFSFLFGLGFVIFYERAKARSSKPTRLFMTRLVILLVIGLLHAFFIWFGDVLTAYALFGFLLPIFFNRKPKTLIIWVIVFFAIFLSLFALVVGVMALLYATMDEAALAAMMQPMVDMMQSGLKNSLYAYGEGSFAAIMAQRMADVRLNFSQLWIMFFLIFPLFLLGVWAGTKKIFQNIEHYLPFIKKAWMWGLIIGLPMSILKFYAFNQMDHLTMNFFNFLFYAAGIFADTGMAIFYMASIVLLFQRQNWVPKLKPFGYVGRMALSNYLLQSIIGTMIFYSYGLGLYGQIAPALGMALALVIFAIQIIISKWWLSRYQFGPVEWVWKSLTYNRRFKSCLTANDISKI